MLHPREVVFPLMFASDGKSNDGRTVGSFFAEELLKETRETTYAALQIKNAPAGARAGKFVTGETNGEAAACKPQENELQRHSGTSNGVLAGVSHLKAGLPRH
ncbi:MAG: hypothetical protein WCB27_17440 [Thermoguttaceae bacterium]